MNSFPLEEATFRIANQFDEFIHSHPILYESRLIGIVASAGLLTALPFYEIALTIEHLTLAIFNKLNQSQISKEDYQWTREIHIKRAVQHITSAFIIPVALAVDLLSHAITLLNPYFYYWSQPNNYLATGFLLESETLSEKLCYNGIKILNRPECKTDRVANIVNQSIEHLNNTAQKDYKNGCFMEKSDSCDSYLIMDGQHHRIWNIKNDGLEWQINERVLNSNPFVPFKSPQNAISFSLSNQFTIIPQ